MSRLPPLIQWQPPCRQVPRPQDPPVSASGLDSACTSVLASVYTSTFAFICVGLMHGVPGFAAASWSAKVSPPHRPRCREESKLSLLLARLLGCLIVLSPTHRPFFWISSSDYTFPSLSPIVLTSVYNRVSAYRSSVLSSTLPMCHQVC